MSDEEDYTNRPYILSDSEEELTENGIQGPRSKIRHNWLFQQTFETAEQALLWIKNDGCWAAGFIFSSLAIGIERCGLQKLPVVNLLADAADSITNGFKLAFGETGRRGKIFFLSLSFFHQLTN